MIFNNEFLNKTKNKQKRIENIKYLIIHHTAGKYPTDLQMLNGDNKSSGVSVHYYITKGGTIFKLLDDNFIAYHTGNSDKGPVEFVKGWGWNLNPISIGIELENLGNGFDSFPENQIKSLIDLTKSIVKQYNISFDNILGHKEITSRKIDPATNFYPGDMILFRDNIKKEFEKKYSMNYGIEIFEDLEDNYEIKKLIEIGLLKFYNNYNNGTLKIR